MKQSKFTKAMALMLSLVMITSVFVGNTLSRYVTSVSSTDSARVAVWGINGEEVTMELFKSAYEVDGKKIAESNNKTDKIIAPGTGGEAAFNIINYEDSNIPPEVAYQVKIDLDDSAVDDKIKNNTSIQWKLDNGNYGTWDELVSSLLLLSGDPSGTYTYAPGEFATAFQGTQEHKIYWQWLLDNNNNETDTSMGDDALTGPISAQISVRITAQQTDDLVTNQNMLNGANQVVNVDDIQPAVFRSKSDISNFEGVEVDGEPIDEGTDYTVTSGSTVITLNKDFLKTLDEGSHTIDIISSDMTASTRFSLKEAPIVHGNVIPEGGTYYVGVTGTLVYEDPNSGFKEYMIYKEDYSTATEVLTAGDNFPETVSVGDVYVYGDYEYRYGMSFEEIIWSKNKSQNGWGVTSISAVENPGAILSTINGKNIVSMRWAFPFANLITAPEIPNTVIDMSHAFHGCGSLVNVPIIPDGVTNMEYTFYNCTSLVNAPVIPNSVVNMSYAFAGCESLVEAPEIPNSVVNMSWAFNFTSLVSAPVIPDSVTNMFGTFASCHNLTGTIEINANPTNYESMFFLTDKPITLIGESTMLNEIAAGYDNVTVASN